MGNGDLIEELKSIIANSNTQIPQKACNRLILQAMIQLFEGQKETKDWIETLRPIAAAYKGTVKLAWALGISGILSVVGFLWGLLTHAITIIVP